MISPITANMMILAHCFDNANIASNVLMEIRALFECDIEGEIDNDEEDATSILYYYIFLTFSWSSPGDSSKTGWTLQSIWLNLGLHIIKSIPSS